MPPSRPFISEDPETNRLIDWILRHFVSKDSNSNSSIMKANTPGTRDKNQPDGTMRYRTGEDKDGKYIQPVVKHQGVDYPSLKVGLDGNIRADIMYPLGVYDPEPGRSSSSNIHGGLLALATAQPLDSVPTNLNVSQGIGKLVIVINAGSDVSGSITVTGATIDRNDGTKTAGDTDTITVDAVTTDNSSTDSNGNTKYSFSGAYVTSKWFTGSVVLSTSDLTLTDVDVYHCSFEQVNDVGDLQIDTFDVNLKATNVAAEYDAYLYLLDVQAGNDKCNISLVAELHLGADGETAVANKYYRLRRGNLNKKINGKKDGMWAEVHYSNSPAYVEDMNLKVWVRKHFLKYRSYIE